jgi:diaminopimelate epimerase
MGNPHCVIFQDEVEKWPIESWGPAFENHPAFPERINTEFARIIDRKHIRMRVWERGSGETMACGTGACATLAAAVLNQRTERCAILCLNGGELEIEWDEKTGHIFMTGPAEFVFDGSIETEE